MGFGTGSLWNNKTRLNSYRPGTRSLLRQHKSDASLPLVVLSLEITATSVLLKGPASFQYKWNKQLLTRAFNEVLVGFFCAIWGKALLRWGESKRIVTTDSVIYLPVGPREGRGFGFGWAWLVAGLVWVLFPQSSASSSDRTLQQTIHHISMPIYS